MGVRQLRLVIYIAWKVARLQICLSWAGPSLAMLYETDVTPCMHRHNTLQYLKTHTQAHTLTRMFELHQPSPSILSAYIHSTQTHSVPILGHTHKSYYQKASHSYKYTPTSWLGSLKGFSRTDRSCRIRSQTYYIMHY